MKILSVYVNLDHSPFEFNMPENVKPIIHNSSNFEDLKLQLCISSESYDLICVSNSLLKHWNEQGYRFDKAYFANWLRLLKPGGKLHLENTGYISCDELGLANLLISAGYQEDNHFQLIKKLHLEYEYILVNLLVRDSYFLESKGDMSGAIQALIILWALKENDRQIVLCISNIFLRQGWNELIISLWSNFLHKYNDIPNAIYSALQLLILGNYYEGFKLRELTFLNIPYQRRCKQNPPLSKLAEKRWQGESLENRTFVIWSEFGLGDEIMFSQLAYFFKHFLKVKKLIVIVQEPIFELIKTHPDIDEVIELSKANEIKSFDYWDWPHALLSRIEKPDFTNIPKRYPYLFADPKKQAFFAGKLKNQRKIKVGLAWRGDKTHENDKYRSVHNINLLDILLNISDVEWYCLQKDLNESEQNWVANNNISAFSSDLNDFTDTAALASQMDLIIAVDTSVVHLAGALNIPTFLMLPYPYDWRWGLPNQQNLWYPSIQTFFPDYPDMETTMPQVIPKVKQALAEFISQR